MGLVSSCQICQPFGDGRRGWRSSQQDSSFGGGSASVIYNTCDCCHFCCYDSSTSLWSTAVLPFPTHFFSYKFKDCEAPTTSTFSCSVGKYPLNEMVYLVFHLPWVTILVSGFWLCKIGPWGKKSTPIYYSAELCYVMVNLGMMSFLFTLSSLYIPCHLHWIWQKVVVVGIQIN